MATIKELIEQYRDKLAESKLDPGSVAPQVRAGVEGNIRNAIKELPVIARAYRDEVIKHAVILAVSGDGSKEFANIVKYKHKLITIDYLSVLNNMIESLRRRGVRPDYYHNEAFWLTLDEFNKLKVDYEILSIPAPTVNHISDAVYGQPLDKAMKNLLEKNYNNQLYSIVTKRDIGMAALAIEHVGKALPIILYNYSGNLDESVLPRPLLVVEAGEGTDEAFVSKSLAEFRAKFSPSRSKKPAVEQTTEQGEQS